MTGSKGTGKGNKGNGQSTVVSEADLDRFRKAQEPGPPPKAEDPAPVISAADLKRWQDVQRTGVYTPPPSEKTGSSFSKTAESDCANPNSLRARFSAATGNRHIPFLGHCPTDNKPTGLLPNRPHPITGNMVRLD